MKETSGAFKTLWGTSDGIAGDGGAKGVRLFLPFYLFTFLPLKAFLPFWKACGVYYLKTYFPAGVLLNFT
jgi:hypothetical protein